MLTILARVLEILFAVGIMGSGVVVIWTFVEDLRDVGADEEVKVKKAM